MRTCILLLIFSSFYFTSCDNSNNESSEIKSAVEKSVEIEPVILKTNENFRNLVVSKMTNQDDVKGLNIILDKLDKNKITFCDFVKRLYALDDSCLALAKNKFPNAEQYKENSTLYKNAIKISRSKYLKSINMTEHDATYAIVSYVTDKSVNNFCGSY